MVYLASFKTTFDKLSEIPIEHGNMIYCSDTKEVFYDNEDLRRGLVDCVICETENNRLEIPVNKRRYDTLYFVVLTSKFYIMDLETRFFKEVERVDEISYLTGETIDLRPAFLKDLMKHYAPYVMSSSVLMDESMEYPDGPISFFDWLQDPKLRNGYGTKTHFEVRETTIEKEDIESILIPYPIANYIANGLHFVVFRNGRLMDSSDFEARETELYLTDPEDKFELGEQFTFVFIYSTVINPEGHIFELDGAGLIDASVNLEKLKNHWFTAKHDGDDKYYGNNILCVKYKEGMEFLVKFENENLSETPTLNINTFGEFPIKKNGENIPIGLLKGFVYLFYQNESFEIKSVVDSQSTLNVTKHDSMEYNCIYHIEKDGELVGEPICIPKSISSGNVLYCTEKNNPIEGLEVGDPYLDLKIDETHHIYIPASDLVDTISIEIQEEGNIITKIDNDKNKLFLTKKNLRTDWNETDENSLNYIFNKPESLKNPNKLILNEEEYDGSKELVINTKKFIIGDMEYNGTEEVKFTKDAFMQLTHTSKEENEEEYNPKAGETIELNNFELDEYGHIIKLNKKLMKIPSPSSVDSNEKLFLIGALSQSDQPEGTFSHDNVYIDADGNLYSAGNKTLTLHSTENTEGYFYEGETAPTGTKRLNYSGYLYATRMYNAVYNDYAELFLKDDPNEIFEPGDVVVKVPGKNTYTKSSKVGDSLVVGVVSGNYGHLLGGTGDPEYDAKHYIPVGLAGVIPVKINHNYFIEEGDLLISGQFGKATLASSIDNPTGKILGKVLKVDDDHSTVLMLIMNA